MKAVRISKANARLGESLDGAIEPRWHQHHRVQAARPYSVEPGPKQAVDREQSRAARTPATKNVQLMTEGEVLHFHCSRPGNRRATTDTIDRTALCMPATPRWRISQLQTFRRFRGFWYAQNFMKKTEDKETGENPRKQLEQLKQLVPEELRKRWQGRASVFDTHYTHGGSALTGFHLQ